MHPYLLNKVVGLLAPLLLITFGAWWFAVDDPHYWWLLLVIAQSLGFVHYVLGYTYQFSAFERRGQHGRMKWVIILSVASIAAVVLAAALGYFWLMVMVTVPYFLFHGVLNEHTLMERQVGYAPAQSQLLALGVLMVGFFLLAYGHSSFFTGVEALSLPAAQFTELMRFVTASLPISLFQYAAVACFVVFLLVVPGRMLLERNWGAGLLIGVLALSTIVAALAAAPLHYIVLLTIALVYHFVSWSFFYFQEFRQKQPEKLRRYLLAHVVVLVPVAFLAASSFGFFPWLGNIHIYIFNDVLFIGLTAAHISASFVNDEWFLRLVKVN